MFTKNPNTFIYWWNSSRIKGKKYFVMKKHLLKDEFIYSIIYTIMYFLYKMNNNLKPKYATLLYFTGFLLVSLLSYTISHILWRYYSKKYFKATLTSFMENTDKLHIINKIKE